MLTIAVLSQKGGVGKTLTCSNLAAAMADLGLGVLMVDFDPQADLSTSWGLDEDDQRPRIEDSIEDSEADVRDALEHIPLGDGYGTLSLLPTGYERLRRLTGTLLDGDGRQLAELLSPLSASFDVAVIDTPAGDTVFGRQALLAAQTALVPMLPGFHELRALTRSLDVLDHHASLRLAEIHLLGVLVVNADPRWRSTKEYIQHLASMATEQRMPLFETMIPRHQPVTEHARYGLPTVWLRPQSTVAIAYRALAEEVARRLTDHYGVTDVTSTVPVPSTSQEQ